jgi:hypothetical protein
MECLAKTKHGGFRGKHWRYFNMAAIATDDRISEQLLPFRWAESLTTCTLLWVPASMGQKPECTGFPIPAGNGQMPDSQRQWLLQFLQRFSRQVQQQEGLSAESFLQMKTMANPGPLQDRFFEVMLQSSPIGGLSREPNSPGPKVVTEKDIELFKTGKKKFIPFEYMDDTCYWFLNASDDEVREWFMGHGGLTTLFVEPAASSGPPKLDLKSALGPYSTMKVPRFLREHPMLKEVLPGPLMGDLGGTPPFIRNNPAMQAFMARFRVERMRQRSGVLQSPFLARSKEVFGTGLKRDVKFEFMQFIIPRLSSQDFFSHTATDVGQWFEVFHVYINESHADNGIIIASRKKIVPLVVSIVAEMRNEGFRYWEG